MKQHKVFALTALLLGLPAIQARGELVTFAFAGTVTLVDIDSRVQSFAFPRIGDSFSGFYSFDSSVQTSPRPPGEGLFYFPMTKGSVSTGIGDLQFFGPALVTSAYSDFYGVGDWLPSMEVTSNAALAGILNRVNFELRVAGSNLFDDPSILPLNPPSLVGADQATLNMQMDSSHNFSPIPYVVIAASLDSLARVPEPSSGLPAFLAALLVTRRRAPQ